MQNELNSSPQAPQTPVAQPESAAQRSLSDIDTVRSHMAADFEEAYRRFNAFRRVDPFPDIEPALLNCADFCDYIAETGMLFPFHVNEEDIKLASCDFGLLGRAIFWEDRDGKSTRVDTLISKGETFTLQPNSIAFVTLEPYLQIPDYIALRFNLRIKNVYRGLLLGTGPIIDPGYQGRLSIPLHNLTTNPYNFQGGEALISVEFTKIAPHPEISRGRPNIVKKRSKLYIPFSEPQIPNPTTTERNVSFFLQKADPQRPIQSSLPSSIKKLADSALAAGNAATAAEKEAKTIGVVALIGFVLAIASLVGTVIASFQQTREAQQDIKIELSKVKDDLRSLNNTLHEERATNRNLTFRIDSIRDSLLIGKER